MMSSEDECENENGQRYFLVRPPKSRTKRFLKLLKVVDEAYINNCSKRSRDQMIERKMGEPSERTKPKSLKFGYDIFVC